MKKVLLFSVFFACIFTSHAQKFFSDIFIPSTVLIKTSTGGSSSGVIIGDSTYRYLVTARHCIIQEFHRNSVKLVAPNLTLIYYLKDPSSFKSDSVIVDLNSAFANGDVLFDSVHDIAVVIIAKKGPNGLKFTSGSYRKTEFTPQALSTDLGINFDKVQIGDDCMMFGYPSSLQSNIAPYNFDMPLLRKGLIAGKDKNNGTIIIDCPSYKGNSGGPVFSISLLVKDVSGLIGIVSQAVLQVENLYSSYYGGVVSVNYSNSGYTVITPIEYALNLIKKHTEKHK